MNYIDLVSTLGLRKNVRAYSFTPSCVRSLLTDQSSGPAPHTIQSCSSRTVRYGDPLRLSPRLQSMQYIQLTLSLSLHRYIIKHILNAFSIDFSSLILAEHTEK